jgi:hypothetical protein
VVVFIGLLGQDAKRQRARPSESGCDRNALENPAFATEAGPATDRDAAEQETSRHHRTRSCRVAGPTVVPAPQGGGRAGQPGDGYARKDRDRAEVVHPPLTSWPGRRGIGWRRDLLVRSLARKVTDVIGDEQSRSNQPDARSCDERRDAAGSNPPPIGAPKAQRSARIENSRNDEVGALLPTSTTDRKRTDRVAPPVVSTTRGSDRGESCDEERPGDGTAEDLSKTPAC